MQAQFRTTSSSVTSFWVALGRSKYFQEVHVFRLILRLLSDTTLLGPARIETCLSHSLAIVRVVKCHVPLFLVESLLSVMDFDGSVRVLHRCEVFQPSPPDTTEIPESVFFKKTFASKCRKHIIAEVFKVFRLQRPFDFAVVF